MTRSPRASSTRAAVKPKIAFYWCASCGACEEAIIDLDEKSPDLAAAVEIVFWPCTMDYKYADVEALANLTQRKAIVDRANRQAGRDGFSRL